MDPENLMQGGIRRSSIWTDICCLGFVLGYFIFNFLTTPQNPDTPFLDFDPITSMFVGFAVLLVGFNIYQRYAWKARVRKHILQYMNRRVPIVNLMKELNLPFLDLMYFVEQLQKKKLTIEINERTGEILVGDVPPRSGYMIQEKVVESQAEKAPQPKKEIKSQPSVGDMATCPHCNAKVRAGFQYCDRCGKRITSTSDEE